MADELLGRIRAEIDARMGELRPHVSEYEQMLSAAAALGLDDDAPARPSPRSARARRGTRSTPTPRAARARKPPVPRKPPVASARARAPRGAAQQAILAALEHGSHTVSELTVVTAMSAAIIRENLRRLLEVGAVTRAKREGKAAYALSRR
jgi:hypothetical protein